jgi:hypothetical protein
MSDNTQDWKDIDTTGATIKLNKDRADIYRDERVSRRAFMEVVCYLFSDRVMYVKLIFKM